MVGVGAGGEVEGVADDPGVAEEFPGEMVRGAIEGVAGTGGGDGREIGGGASGGFGGSMTCVEAL